MQETGVRKIPQRRAWQHAAVFLPGEFHGQRSLEGYSPWGCKKSDTAEQLRLSHSAQKIVVCHMLDLQASSLFNIHCIRYRIDSISLFKNLQWFPIFLIKFFCQLLKYNCQQKLSSVMSQMDERISNYFDFKNHISFPTSHLYDSLL